MTKEVAVLGALVLDALPAAMQPVLFDEAAAQAAATAYRRAARVVDRPQPPAPATSARPAVGPIPISRGHRGGTATTLATASTSRDPDRRCPAEA